MKTQLRNRVTRQLCRLFVFVACFCFYSPLRSQASYDFVVARDGSGNFKTIQEAITACRDYAERQYVIFIKNGVYNEKLLIPTWKTHIAIIGQDVDSTVITYNDYSGKTDSLGRKFNTFTSFTCMVAGNNITFENITFVNSAGRVGQAVALHVEGDRCIFKNCRLVGNQDTLFSSGENSRQYYVGCTIEGTTDFIFGAATAVFENCTIISKVNSYVTAASTPPTQQYGFVFLRCRLLSDSVGRKVYLGRPWRLYAYTTFVNCEMGEHIRPEGWHNWSKPEAETTARYSEYNSTGPGANPASRVTWSRQLTKVESGLLMTRNVLKGFDNWDPTSAR
ncbi:MAG: pectinesterase family protein [Ignavibacteriales bacterium]|nr:pectinesterase family protein [Ignavibacteriales bacterium]